ncbi:hypothetical protein TWF703_008220 [Orbilia oligospora]|uniref:Uncharacterized protein n=1 Tax=Orbilia oligospora TaxID=2813651 RepID=A0A7C8P5K9_ORBOL|nr:hypothetical protein TWF703_008220 [Orbilia oligospora]
MCDVRDLYAAAKLTMFLLVAFKIIAPPHQHRLSNPQLSHLQKTSLHTLHIVHIATNTPSSPTMPRPSSSPSKSSDPPPADYPLPFLTDPDAASKPIPPSTTLPYRLNLHPISRLTIANIFAFAAVFIPTTIRTAHISSLVYRAENAHRLPEKRADWFHYHRAKNHYAASKGLAEGFKRAGGVCGYVSLFLVVEGAVDGWKGGVDFVGSLVGGGVTGGWFGVARKLPLPTKALMVKKGLWYGFVYGVAQDVMLAMRGERVFWIDPFVTILVRDGDGL